MRHDAAGGRSYTPMSTITTRLRRTATASAALAAATAALLPAAAMAGREPDPSINETGIPADVVEHGVVDFRISGSPTPMHRTIEYWASGDRWRSVTSDAKTDVVLGEAYGDADATHFVNLRMPNTDPRIVDLPFAQLPPMAGWGAPYNKTLLDAGLLRAVGPRTVAGVHGTEYVVPREKQTSDPDAGDDMWRTDEPNSKTVLVLENGTLAPLVRETSLAESDARAGGGFGTFVQREALTFRTRQPRSERTFAPLSRQVLRHVKRAWPAKVRAARHRRPR